MFGGSKHAIQMDQIVTEPVQSVFELFGFGRGQGNSSGQMAKPVLLFSEQHFDEFVHSSAKFHPFGF
jgi:hypothetical protein